MKKQAKKRASQLASWVMKWAQDDEFLLVLVCANVLALLVLGAVILWGWL